MRTPRNNAGCAGRIKESGPWASYARLLGYLELGIGATQLFGRRDPYCEKIYVIFPNPSSLGRGSDVDKDVLASRD